MFMMMVTYCVSSGFSSFHKMFQVVSCMTGEEVGFLAYQVELLSKFMLTNQGGTTNPLQPLNMQVSHPLQMLLLLLSLAEANSISTHQPL